jgi:hypothetical protein
MTTPATGPLALSAVNAELGLASTTQISMSAALTRTLAGVASGAIRFSDLRGKTLVTYVISADTADAVITLGTTTPTTGTYVAGASIVIITVNSDVYVYSTSTSTPALTLTGGTTGDTITLYNNGFIMGCGGNGGGSNSTTIGYSYGGPTAGGTALKVGYATSVVLGAGSCIAGGGGGGGGTGGFYGGNVPGAQGGGGGAGGGTGGNGYVSPTSTPQTQLPGGSGGAVRQAGQTNTKSGGSGSGFAGGGGGRFNPLTGTGGAGTTKTTTGVLVYAAPAAGGQAGGSGALYGGFPYPLRATGGGGGWGATGGGGEARGFGVGSVTSGSGGANNSAGTGGTVANAQTLYQTTTGAVGGKAIDFNSKTVLISGPGITYGITS